MKSNLPISLLFAISSLCSPAYALPFLQWTAASSEPIVVARYSVVPIDGGSGASESSESGRSATTVVETIVATATPVTKTITETSPPLIEHQTNTILVTATPTAGVIVSTISIVNVEPVTTTAVVIATVTPSSSSLTSTTNSVLVIATTQLTVTTPIFTLSATPTSSASSVSFQNLTMTSPTSRPLTESTTFPPLQPSSSTSDTLAIPTVSKASTFIPILTVSAPPTATILSTYDNGQWHTTYPAWNGTVRRRYARDN